MIRFVYLFTPALAALGALLFWLIRGAHVGWTQTSVKIEQFDPVTGLNYPVYEDRFLPGLDFLVCALTLAALFALFGFLLYRRQRRP